jgi:hypothetical protein
MRASVEAAHEWRQRTGRGPHGVDGARQRIDVDLEAQEVIPSRLPALADSVLTTRPLPSRKRSVP